MMASWYKRIPVEDFLKYNSSIPINPCKKSIVKWKISSMKTKGLNVCGRYCGRHCKHGNQHLTHWGCVTMDAHYIPTHICITLEVYVEDRISCC
jgi:hypothetical protein